MKKAVLITLVVVAVAIVVGAIGLVSSIRYGFSAHDQPTRVEAMIARTVRNWSIPLDLHHRTNPVSLTPAVLAEARAHWADHCAICHGNDGKGQTDMGMHMYPRPPDMTLRLTQELSDGALFSIIENGIRLTGMPGFGNGTAESAYESWTLVHFIRHLPKITPEELEQMAGMNPISPQEFREQQESEEFLEGGADSESAPAPHHESKEIAP